MTQSRTKIAAQADTRLSGLRRWLAGHFGDADFELETASADASFRRYFRVRRGQNCWIAMDAPPAQEDSRPFVEIAELMRRAGLHVPRILAQDLARGYLLLEDLGDRLYLDALLEDQAGELPDVLFADAIAALVDWQAVSRPGVLPDYDSQTLMAELRLFPEWYLGRHLGVDLRPAERAGLDAAFERIVTRALAQPRVFVHRDYMPRNLMVCDPNPGVLDFQDARYGPVTYDVVSLFKDAFISWPPARVTAWLEKYWQAAATRGIPVGRDFDAFREDLDWMGLQRHLKVLGIFARIRYRDGKPRYLEDAPRFIDYVRPVLRNKPELADFTELFERHVVASS